MAKPDPVVVVGAGPVGLCLALALAQQDFAVVVIESMTDETQLFFAESVTLTRAGRKVH